MITHVELRGYRALRAPLGAFQVLDGPNASGKSTFFDVLAFVRDVLQVDLEGAVFGNARVGIPMRAAVSDLSCNREGAPIEIAIVACTRQGPMDGAGATALSMVARRATQAPTAQGGGRVGAAGQGQGALFAGLQTPRGHHRISRCTDPTFVALRDALRARFPAEGYEARNSITAV